MHWKAIRLKYQITALNLRSDELHNSLQLKLGAHVSDMYRCIRLVKDPWDIVRYFK